MKEKLKILELFGGIGAPRKALQRLGIPQNRERVFTISVRNDIDKGYTFPEPQELRLKLKDMLENNVDEKYYLRRINNDKVI